MTYSLTSSTWAALRPFRGRIALASLLYSSHQAGEALVPILIGLALDAAAGNGSALPLPVWIGLLAADFGFLSLSYRFGARISMRAKQGTEHRQRMALVSAALHPAATRPAASRGGSAGDLLSRASSDAGQIGALAGMIAASLAALMALLLSIVWLLLSSPLLGLAILAGTILVLTAQHLAARAIHQRSTSQQEAVADATAEAEDLVRGLRVIHGLGVRENASQRFHHHTRAFLKAASATAAAQARLNAVSRLCAGLYMLGVTALGAYLASTGQLSAGALISSLGLALFVAGPMETLAAFSGSLTRARAASVRVHDAGTALHAPTSPGAATHKEGGASEEGGARGESASPEPRAGVVPLSIGDHQLSLTDGHMTGIACVSSTDAAGLMDALQEQDHPDLLIGLHNAALLPGTLRENLALIGHPEKLDAASAAAQLDQVINGLPQGEATNLGHAGETLSGGQSQRVALARVLAADAPSLVLHEPTTAVDSVTGMLIAKAVTRLRSGSTTVVISTSPDWLAQCDMVFLLGPARSVKRGTHQDLISTSATYRELVAR